MRVPDFIIAGAPRSGTTWLWYLLNKHPGIYVTKPASPEPKFFLVDDLYQRGIEYYAQTWFSNIGEGLIAGEKSTNYLESPVVASRIFEALPKVKLIFMLRDPIERAYSNYLWSRMNGLEQESFERAIELEESREKSVPEKWRYARPHAYVSRGYYAQLLKPFFDAFPRDHILCLRHEQIIQSSSQLACTIHKFLNVEERPQDADGLGTVRPSDKTARDKILDNTREFLREHYFEHNRALAKLLGAEYELWNRAQ